MRKVVNAKALTTQTGAAARRGTMKWWNESDRLAVACAIRYIADVAVFRRRRDTHRKQKTKRGAKDRSSPLLYNKCKDLYLRQIYRFREIHLPKRLVLVSELTDTYRRHHGRSHGTCCLTVYYGDWFFDSFGNYFRADSGICYTAYHSEPLC